MQNFIFASISKTLIAIVKIMTKRHYNRIKAVLAEKGVTNKELAEALQIAPQTVSRWCTNDMQPSIEKLFLISRFLEVEARDLLVSNNNYGK